MNRLCYSWLVPLRNERLEALDLLDLLPALGVDRNVGEVEIVAQGIGDVMAGLPLPAAAIDDHFFGRRHLLQDPADVVVNRAGRNVNGPAKMPIDPLMVFAGIDQMRRSILKMCQDNVRSHRGTGRGRRRRRTTWLTARARLLGAG